MCFLYGYQGEEQESFTDKGERMRAPVDMSCWALKNIAAPVDDYDAVSKKYMETVLASREASTLRLRHSIFYVFNNLVVGVTKTPKTTLDNNPYQKLVAYTPHATSRLVVHSPTFDDDEQLPTSCSLEIGMMTYQTDGTKKVHFVKKIDMQNLTARTITMEDTVRMVVVQESFPFPDTDATVFSFHGVLLADFTNGCEISLHVSVYDANPTFV